MINSARLTIGYARVSSQDQAANGISLDAQQERLRAFALATDRHIDEIVVDAGESAKTLNRTGMARILDDARARRLGTLIIFKLDRLTRSVRDLADLLDLFERHQVALVSLSESLDTSTAAGRLMLNLLASVSQWEREAIGERTAVALTHKRRLGKVYGQVPFGWRRDRDNLVPEPQELYALRAAARMRREGWSLSRIGHWLTSQGVKPRQGGATWRRSSVAQVLASKIALGQ